VNWLLITPEIHDSPYFIFGFLWNFMFLGFPAVHL